MYFTTTTVPGVSFAEAGSTLCGTGVCPAGQRCFDGWNCCPLETPVCGAQCCQAPSVCVSNKCVAPGSIPCGTTVCTGGLSCIQDVCCSADRVVCGGKCCDTGQSCILGVCAAAGSRQCGQGICDATQSCVDGVCCAMGETACGGRCCPAGNTCLQGQFCAPTGSTMCGNGQICNAPLQCAGGMLCCDAGASFCGGACCPATSQCQAGRCLAAGQTLCGTTVCGIGQTCQGGMVCCDTSATFCNNACCANGNTCVNNQCVPTGSVPCGTTVCPPNQICGNPSTGVCWMHGAHHMWQMKCNKPARRSSMSLTAYPCQCVCVSGLCCQSLNQFGCGTACCNSFTDVCDQYRQICTPRFNTGEQSACLRRLHIAADMSQPRWLCRLSTSSFTQLLNQIVCVCLHVYLFPPPPLCSLCGGPNLVSWSAAVLSCGPALQLQPVFA